MIKINVISERAYEKWPSWFVVYEWEDVFAKNGLNLKILKYSFLKKCFRKLKHYILKYVVRKTLRFKTDNKEYNIRWIMDARNYKSYVTKNSIPIFLDFPISMINEINEATKNLPFYWVTCKDIFDILKSKGSNNVYFIPLSISDKYYTGKIPTKKIDVIQFGRKNAILHEYMMKYCENHPNVEYVFQTEDGSLTYESTTRGNIGKFDDRKDYFKMLANSKVSLVSSPGKDKSRVEFGNIDFITPRFYESAVNYCHMIGRYTLNEESKIIGISDICPNVETYEEFEEILNRYLADKKFEDKKIFDGFLLKNMSSKRAKDIINTINDINFLDKEQKDTIHSRFR